MQELLSDALTLLILLIFALRFGDGLDHLVKSFITKITFARPLHLFLVDTDEVVLDEGRCGRCFLSMVNY